MTYLQEFRLSKIRKATGWYTPDAIKHLCGLKEAARRRLLRPHWEEGISDKEAPDREQLDSVLDALVALELGYSTNYLEWETVEEQIDASIRKLWRQPSVGRYIGDYDYFSVCFLASEWLTRRRKRLEQIKLQRKELKRKELEAAVAAGQRPRPKLRERFKSWLSGIKSRLQPATTRQLTLPLPPLKATLTPLPTSSQPGINEVEAFLDWSAKFHEGGDPDQEAQVASTKRLFRLLEDFCEPKPINKANFARWLADKNKDLRFPDPAVAAFQQMLEGGAYWCVEKARLYRDCHPYVQTRFAFFDFYWLTRLFNADVGTTGKVVIKGQSWLDAFAAKLPEKEGGELLGAKEILQQAWSLACNWLQDTPFEPDVPGSQMDVLSKKWNYLLANLRRRAKGSHWTIPDWKVSGDPNPFTWNQVFDDELQEIAGYHRERPSLNGTPPATGVPPTIIERLRIRKDLTGLAFSGGGIRSASFNLGVIEGLKECDLLRQIDYLSTVSGGGYIGAWLIGNTYRGSDARPPDSVDFKRRSWLSQAADWRNSIQHLRRYSNYLAPRVSLLSADIWTVWSIWSRNTILVQLLVFLSIATALLVPHLWKLGMERADSPWWLSSALLGSGVALIAINLIFSGGGTPPDPQVRFYRLPFNQKGVQMLIVSIVSLAALSFSTDLWRMTEAVPNCPLCNLDSYSAILRSMAGAWTGPLVALAVFLLVLSASSVRSWQAWHRRVVPAISAAAVAFAGLYLAVCAMLWLFLSWRRDAASGVWLAASLGPILAIISLNLAIILLLGILSRSSNEVRREWWSRLGAWLTIYTSIWLLASLGAVFAPLWIATASSGWTTAGAFGWIATTVGGLLAGNSSDTGEHKTKSGKQIAKEWIARLAPYVFVAGLLAALSSLLHFVLLYIDDVVPPQGRFVDYYWLAFNSIHWRLVLEVFGLLALVTTLYQWVLDINVFSLSSFYQNRLVRCYLGATRDPEARVEQRFTGFDDNDDLRMSEIRYRSDSVMPFTGPFPIVNCALNLGGSSDLALHTRQSASFTITPLHVGSSRPDVGYAPLIWRGEPYYGGRSGGPTLGRAITISGAAASPNMGYHTSTVVAFLLTVFNVRLGAWFPHPDPSHRAARKSSPRSSLAPLVSELLGLADSTKSYLNLSDGGHFENLGIYELVRRRCRVIIASDAECDPGLGFGSLGNVIRLCEVDFGARINIDVSSIAKQPDSEFSSSHSAVGHIYYDDGTEGWLIYMKSSLTSDEGTAIMQYKKDHPTFPHETTADQFFGEDQFESYRELGRSVALRTFRDARPATTLLRMAPDLEKQWAPSLTTNAKFVNQTERLVALWNNMSEDPELHALGQQLLERPQPGSASIPYNPHKAFYICCQCIQLMENVYLDLNLDDTFDHPDNAGWKAMFERWAASDAFQSTWKKSCEIYGLRFRHFCERRLGLPAE